MLCMLDRFFCRQKTTYERRMRYWSSDVCSTDLSDAASEGRTRHGSNPFTTYSGPTRLGLARRCHAPTGNGSQTTGAAHADCRGGGRASDRSEEHTSELQSLMRISYAVFCLKKKN